MTEQAEVQGELVDGSGTVVNVDDVIAANEKPKDDKPVETKTDRPEWLDERFKSPEDLAKSYKELEQTLRAKGKVAPEAYELNDPENAPIDTSDEVFVKFQDFAKENNLNNAQFNAVLEFAAESGLLDAPNYDEELAKLGSEKDTIINGLTSFAQAKLTPAEQQALEGLVYTADAAKLLHKIIRMSGNPVPAKPGDSVSSKESLQTKLNTLLADPNIRNDREKQAEAIELSNRLATL
jgi:hypothetical protein